MLTVTGRHGTLLASRYLQQLCKHFAHKTEATWDETSGLVVLGAARARLGADDAALVVTIEAEDPAGLARGQGVIDSHLARFAFREGFERMDWDTPQEAASGAS